MTPMTELVELFQSLMSPEVVLGTVAAAFVVLSLRLTTARMVLRLIAAGFLMVVVGQRLGHRTWGWVAAAIPAVIVVQHAIYLAWIKPRFIDRKPDDLRGQVSHHFRMDLEDAIASTERYFAPGPMALRYGLPTLLLFSVGISAFYVLHPTTAADIKAWLDPGGVWIIKSARLEAARFGAVGAWFAVVLYLSARAFRHDISPGAVTWSAINLAAGPLLAVVCARVWAGTDDKMTGPLLATSFLAGFSPRVVTMAIDSVGRKLIGAPPSDDKGAVPLSSIRGMTPAVIERLAEEGIHDATGLAFADPVRLQRDCSFDKRQLLNWIDEALLVHTLPATAAKLIASGVTGAIDLASYRRDSTNETITAVTPLATAIQVAPVEHLAGVVERMFEDAQVRLVWVLYQLESGAELAAPAPQPNAVGALAQQLVALDLAVKKIAAAAPWCRFHREGAGELPDPGPVAPGEQP